MHICTYPLPISVFLINILSGTKERKSFILRDLESASHQLFSILLFLDTMEASDWSVMTSDWPMTIKSSHASQSRVDQGL